MYGMEIKYHLTEADYIQFNMFHIKNSEAIMGALKKQRFYTPIFYIAFAFIFSKILAIPFLFAFVPFFVLSLLWVLFYEKYFFWRVIRQTKKMIKEGKNTSILGEHQMLLTEEGIVDKTSSGETKVIWSGINELKENENYFYLYNSALSAYILPKQQIQNLDEISSYLKTKLT
jgi:hypothetical protein